MPDNLRVQFVGDSSDAKRIYDQMYNGSFGIPSSDPVQAARDEVSTAQNRAERSCDVINDRIDEIGKLVKAKDARIKKLELALSTVKRLAPHDNEIKAVVCGALS